MARSFQRIALPLLAVGLLTGGPAFAQDDDGEAGEQAIVVSGMRERERKIDEFIDTISSVSVHGPMSRYEEGEYCPGIVGLSQARNEEIGARMRQVAAAAGMEPAGADCRTSALVIFTRDAAEAFVAFRKEHPEYFSELTGDRIVYQGRGGPIVSWKLIGRIDLNRQPVPTDWNGVQIVNLPVASTRLQMATRPVIAMAVVLIEFSAIEGLTAQQIADYAFMRTVSDADPEDLKGTDVPTIMRVMDVPVGGETPLSLTEWDLAYVKGRYASNEWNNGPTQQAKIRGTMRRSLLDRSDED